MEKVRMLRTFFFALPLNAVRRKSTQAVTRKKLFTPGPLSVSERTKVAMLQDFGSRSPEFLEVVRKIERSLLSVAEVNDEEYTAVIFQGCGTYAIEAAIRTATPQNKEVLIISNGLYGKRMELICDRAGLKRTTIHFPEGHRIDLNVVENHLKSGHSYSTVGVIHGETSTGVVNQVTPLGALVKRYCPDSVYVVDAMSSFGAIPVCVKEAKIDYLVTSANKCLQGVPGFALVFAQVKQLLRAKGNCASLSLDLYDQYHVLRNTGQFRFTPPTHALLAMNQALEELTEEGGVRARGQRYKRNCKIVREGMQRFGFKEFAQNNEDGFLITAFIYPKNFHFQDFYSRLSKKGHELYSGNLTEAKTFRIGHIGDLSAEDCQELIQCIEITCNEMGLQLPVQY